MAELTTAAVISLPMSFQDGARAAATLWGDGRITPDLIDSDQHQECSWGDPELNLGTVAVMAFVGEGCEPFSRHHQLTGTNWKEQHLCAFCMGFLRTARPLLWAEGPCIEQPDQI